MRLNPFHMFLLFIYFLSMLCDLWDLSSLTKNWTLALGSKSKESNRWTAREFIFMFLLWHACSSVLPIFKNWGFHFFLLVFSSSLYGLDISINYVCYTCFLQLCDGKFSVSMLSFGQNWKRNLFILKFQMYRILNWEWVIYIMSLYLINVSVYSS